MRFDAIAFTLSVRSFHSAEAARNLCLSAKLSFRSYFLRHAGTSDANAPSWSTMVLIVFFSSRISP